MSFMLVLYKTVKHRQVTTLGVPIGIQLLRMSPDILDLRSQLRYASVRTRACRTQLIAA